MIIKGDKLKLLYKVKGRDGMTCYDNLPEIEKGEWGYKLEAGQRVYAIRYHGTGMELYFDARITHVDNKGITVDSFFCMNPGEPPIFVPWEKEFKQLGKSVICKAYIEPCVALFEKNNMDDILCRNINMNRHHPSGHDYESMWQDYIGLRFEDNLNNFIKLGQMTLF